MLAVALGHVKELHVGGIPLHLFLEHAGIEHNVLHSSRRLSGKVLQCMQGISLTAEKLPQHQSSPALRSRVIPTQFP